MTFLAQLLMQPPPAPYPPPPKPREKASELYGPHLRGKGLVSGYTLQQLTGRSACTVNEAMRRTLIPKGLVRRHDRHDGKRLYFVYEWVGE